MSTPPPGPAEGLDILCLVTDAHGGFGGVAQYNRDLIGAFSRDAAIASVVILPRILKDGTGPLPPKVAYDASAAGPPSNYVRSLVRHALSRRRIDLVFCAHINLLPFACLVGKLRRAPVVLQIHGIDAWQPTRRALTNRLTAHVHHTLSVSALTRDRFCAWSGTPPSRTTIVPNTLHREHFGPDPKPQDLVDLYGLEGRRVVLTFGRLVGEDREKGFDCVLESLPLLIQDVPDLVYLIAGGGPDRERLEQKARALGIAKQCVFTGFVPEERKADLYRLADVFAMPSKGEGFGIVLLEAMACGIPVVASTRDGTREALLDGMLGTLVDPDDKPAVARAINAALAKPKAVPAALDHFSYDAFCARMRDAIAAILARAPGVIDDQAPPRTDGHPDMCGTRKPSR